MQSLRFKALEDVVDLVLPNPLLAAVDASSNRALADKLQVHGYPRCWHLKREGLCMSTMVTARSTRCLSSRRGEAVVRRRQIEARLH